MTNNTVLNPKAIRKNNYRAVVRTFNRDEILSITEITERINMSKTTAAKIVDALVKMGMVTPVGKGSSTDSGGKRPELYSINSMYRYFGMILNEKYRTYVEIRDFLGSAVCNFSEPYYADAEIDYVARIEKSAELLDSLLTENGIDQTALSGVVLAMGNLNYLRRSISASEDVSEEGLKQFISDTFLNRLAYGIPVCVMDSRYLRGFYEFYANPALQRRSVVTITVHKRGVSGCYLKNGSLLQGASGGAMGEFSHIITEFNSPKACECGQKGCFCTVCLPDKILADIKTELPAVMDSVLGSSDEGELTLDQIFAAADAGDALARKHIENIADNFSRLIAVLQATLDPEIIVMQGAYSNPGTFFKKHLQEKLDENRLFSSANLQIEYSQASALEAITLGAFEFCRNNYLESADCFE